MFNKTSFITIYLNITQREYNRELWKILTQVELSFVTLLGIEIDEYTRKKKEIHK